MSGNDVILGLVGDLLVDRAHPAEVFDRVTDLLAAPDLLFGNLEAAFTNDPHPAPSGGSPLFPAAHNLDVFPAIGFDILALANNHIVDGGHAAMLENIARLRAQGVLTCGAGKTKNEAHEPAIITVNGLTIAILAYASVFPMGYEARSNVPGLAPFRAYDLWRSPIDNYHAPGRPPSIRSVPDERDLARLKQDIAAARARADIVITSFHWGDFLVPYHLTDHERSTARLCVDLGVDMVVGHHHHALRGMEWYNGKPILYGLGHFVFDVHLDLSEEFIAMFARTPKSSGDYAIFPRPGWPLLPLHEDTRMTVLAWAGMNKQGVHSIGFTPCRLRPDGRVEAVDPASDEGREVIAYLEECNRSQRLNARITDEGALTLAGHAGMRVVAAE